MERYPTCEHTLHFQTTPGYPQCPVDFEGLDNVVLQFDENTLTRPIVLTIIDDAILEDEENFFGNLSTSDGAVDLLPDTVSYLFSVLATIV